MCAGLLLESFKFLVSFIYFHFRYYVNVILYSKFVFFCSKFNLVKALCVALQIVLFKQQHLF